MKIKVSSLFDLLLPLSDKQKKLIKQQLKDTNLRLFNVYMGNIQEIASKDESFFIKRMYRSSKAQSTYTTQKSTLKQYLEKNLSYIQLADEDLYQHFFALKFLSEIEDVTIYFKYAETFIQILEQQSDKGTIEYLILADMHRQIYYHPCKDKFTNDNDSLTKAASFRKQYCLLHDFQDTAEILSNCIIRKNDETPILEAKYLMDEAKNFEDPVFEIYRIFLELQSSCISNKDKPVLHSSIALSEAVESLINNHQSLSDFDLKLLFNKYIQIINFIIERFDYRNNTLEEQQNCIKLILDLYKLQDKKGLMLHKNRLTAYNYVTVIATAAAVEEFEWCQYFSDKYQTAIAADQNLAIAMGNAYISYYQKDYEQSMAFNEIVEYSAKSIFFKVHSRTLLIQSLYETCSDSTYQLHKLNTQISNTKIFFYRDDFFNETRKMAFKNSVAFVEKLLKNRFDPSLGITEKKQLQGDIFDTYPMVSKKWLIEKSEELFN